MNNTSTRCQLDAAVVDGETEFEVPDPVLEIVKAIAVDIHAFLARWSAKPQSGETRDSCLPLEHDLRQQVVEFQARKDRWEENCRMEAERMRESMNHLTESWLRLEAEQRKLLNSPGGNSLASDRQQGVAVAEINDHAVHQTLSGRLSPDAASHPSADGFSFQQLQREVKSRRVPQRTV